MTNRLITDLEQIAFLILLLSHILFCLVLPKDSGIFKNRLGLAQISQYVNWLGQVNLFASK